MRLIASVQYQRRAVVAGIVAGSCILGFACIFGWGCVRAGFDRRSASDARAIDATSSTDGDASASPPSDGTALPASDGGQAPFGSGTWQLGTVEAVSELNSAEEDKEVSLTGDGLTIYFDSRRAGGLGDTNIYRAVRSSTATPFSTPTPLDELNSTGSSALSVSFDGLWALLTTDRSGGPGGGIDIWYGSRSTTSDSWNIGEFAPETALCSALDDWDAMPSPDGLRVYLARGPVPGGYGGQDIFVAERSSLSAHFGTPTAIPNINGVNNDGDPTLSPDERVIVFASDRQPGIGGRDLWYAVRADRNAPFSEPQRIPNINTADDEAEPTISPDGTELYFGSNRPGGLGQLDIYRVAILAGP